MNTRHLLLVAAVSLVFGSGLAVGTYVASTQHADEMQECNKSLNESKEQVAAFCEGTKMGEIRMVQTLCNGKLELCVCGNPTALKSGN